MIRTRLTYHSPFHLADAVALLSEHGENAVVVGGGTMLIPMMTRAEVMVNHVIDPRKLGLDAISVYEDRVELGARVTYTDLLRSESLRKTLSLFPRVAAGITGGGQIRNQGTIGGSACYANPASDIPANLVALKARMRVEGPDGTREIDAEHFFLDAFRSAVRPSEILTSIAVPRRRLSVGYCKLKLSESSWPIATAVALIDTTAHEASVTLGGVQNRPLRINLGSLVDSNGKIMLDEVEAFVRAQVTEPRQDVLAPREYRQQVSGVIARRAFEGLQELEQQ